MARPRRCSIMMESPRCACRRGHFRSRESSGGTRCRRRFRFPRKVGILALTVDGRAVEFPVWNDDSLLWLRRDASSEETAKDFLGVKVFAAIEDGIPMWLRTQVELVVSGKSRRGGHRQRAAGGAGSLRRSRRGFP